jgi:hypothetical protein
MLSVSVSLVCNARSFLESKQSILGGGLRECQPNHHRAKATVFLKLTSLDLANRLGYDDGIKKQQEAGANEEYDKTRGRRLTNNQRKSSSGVIPT